MKHFIFLFYIISFLSGFSFFILASLAYSKSRNTLLRYYIFLVLSLSVIIIEQTITTYKLVNIFDNNYLKGVLRIISYINIGFLIYILPLFIHQFTGKRISEHKKLVFLVLSIIPVVSIILYFCLQYKSLINTCINVELFATIAYTLLFAIKNMKKEEEKEIRMIMKSILFTTMVFFPFMFLDTKSSQIPLLADLFPYGLLSVPAFYLTINSLSMNFGIKYYSRFNSYVSPKAVTNNKDTLKIQMDSCLLSNYKITNRESEVIMLLIKGYSYSNISEELFISISTAKTHVYNIYQKTGVKNKVELINLVLDV